MSICCNLCGSEEFKDMRNRKNAICVKCGSYERTRVMKLFLDTLGIGPETSILHLAPERGLYAYLKGISKHYVVGDIDLDRYAHIPSIKRIDLCDPTSLNGLGSFDVVIHSHVIEHLPCNYTAALIRLHKVLNPGGVHLFAVPIYGEAYREDIGDIGTEAAEKLFGQFDHCRRFSPGDLQRTIGAIFRIPQNYDLLDFFTAEELTAASVPQDAWKGYTGHSIFRIHRDDLLL